MIGVHGYSDEFLSIKKSLEKLLRFLEFVTDKKIIIHNAEFDIGHLNNELSLIEKDKINISNVTIHLSWLETNFQDLV